MANTFTYKISGSPFESRYTKYEEVGIPKPNQSGYSAFHVGLTDYPENLDIGSGSTINFDWKHMPDTGILWTKVLANPYGGIGLKTDGSVWTYGAVGSGQLGSSSTFYQLTYPAGFNSITDIAMSTYGGKFAIKSDGTLWAWGLQTSGELGLGDNLTKTLPNQVGSLTNWSKIYSGGYSTLAIKTDGTLWAWGRNDVGQLGLGDSTNKSSPVQVGTLTNWASISIELENGVRAFGIKTDGTLWAWGSNSSGELGISNSNTTAFSSPVQVGSLTNWSKVSAGYYHAHAIKTDGTLWSWGLGSNGRLGTGNTTSTSSPVQVGSLTNWSKVQIGRNSINSTTLAIKTDGTLWGWVDLGVVGGPAIRVSSPVQIGSLTNWVDISSSFVALKQFWG